MQGLDKIIFHGLAQCCGTRRLRMTKQEAEAYVLPENQHVDRVTQDPESATRDPKATTVLTGTTKPAGTGSPAA